MSQEHTEELNRATKDDLIMMLNGLEDAVYDHIWFEAINIHLGRYRRDVLAKVEEAASDGEARQALIEAFPTAEQTREIFDVIKEEIARRGIPTEPFLINVVHLGTVLNSIAW